MSKFAVVIFMLVAFVHIGLGQYKDSSGALTTKITDNIGIDDKRGTVVPLAMEFLDEDGKKIMLRDVIQDRPVILMPIFYTCRSACNLVFNGVLEVVRSFKTWELGKDYDIVCLSINHNETPKDALARKTLVGDVVTNSMRKKGMDKGWHFLTGSEANIKAVTDAVGFRFQYDPKTKDFNHAAGVILLTPDGVVSSYEYGVSYVPMSVYKNLQTASAQRIGPEAQKRLFGCIEFDPNTQSYKLNVIRALQLACYATLATLVVSIFVMESKRRRRLSNPLGDAGGPTPKV
jgi:protein SCO1/2